jgi:hypothetical protein
MDTVKRGSRILGLAFLLQFITSISSGVLLRPLWFVPGDMAARPFRSIWILVRGIPETT